MPHKSHLDQNLSPDVAVDQCENMNKPFFLSFLIISYLRVKILALLISRMSLSLRSNYIHDSRLKSVKDYIDIKTLFPVSIPSMN